MDTTRIASTPLLGLTPLGNAGERAYPRLIEILGSRLGPDHAFLLAEPVPDPDGTRIDWYVPGERRAHPVQSLPEEIKAQVEQQADRLQGDVMRLAAALAGSGASGAALAKSLEHAMTVPGPDKLYAVPVETPNGLVYRPVLVAWAHSKAGTPGYLGGLEGKLILPPAPPPPPPPPGATPAADTVAAVALAARAPFRWDLLLLWLLFGLLTAALIWRLLPACGVTGLRLLNISGLSYCRVAPPVVEAALDETPSLRAIIADLESQLARRRNDCRMAELRRPPPAPPQPTPPRNEAQRRVEENRGTLGQLDFILKWDGHADLDLAVIVACPAPRKISFSSRAECGGRFDIDRNNGGVVDNPVENITWADASGAPPGPFRIEVTNYDSNDDPRAFIEFTVTVTEEGKPQPRVYTGRIGRHKNSSTTPRPLQAYSYTR